MNKYRFVNEGALVNLTHNCCTAVKCIIQKKPAIATALIELLWVLHELSITCMVKPKGVEYEQDSTDSKPNVSTEKGKLFFIIIVVLTGYYVFFCTFYYSRKAYLTRKFIS